MYITSKVPVLITRSSDISLILFNIILPKSKTKCLKLVTTSHSSWYAQCWSEDDLIKPKHVATIKYYIYTLVFDGMFERFALLLELKHYGISSIKISYLSLGLPSNFFISRLLISWCIFVHTSCPAYLIFLKYFVENRLFSFLLYNFLDTSDTCSLAVLRTLSCCILNRNMKHILQNLRVYVAVGWLKILNRTVSSVRWNWM